MDEPIDHSDELAKASILVSLLQDFDSTGNWQHNSIYKKWRRSCYSLSEGEFATMIIFLESELKSVEISRQYKQTALFE